MCRRCVGAQCPREEQVVAGGGEHRHGGRAEAGGGGAPGGGPAPQAGRPGPAGGEHQAGRARPQQGRPGREDEPAAGERAGRADKPSVDMPTLHTVCQLSNYSSPGSYFYILLKVEKENKKGKKGGEKV